MFATGVWLLFQGDIVSGVWLAAIAWFLYSAASVEHAAARSRDTPRAACACATSRDRSRPPSRPASASAELVESYMLPHNLRAVPVTDNARLVGIVTISDVLKVPLGEPRPRPGSRDHGRPRRPADGHRPTCAALDARRAAR